MAKVKSTTHGLLKVQFAFLLLITMILAVVGLEGITGYTNISCMSVVCAQGESSLNPDSVDIYFLESSYAEHIENAEYVGSYQINVDGLDGTPTYKIVSGSSYAAVSQDGLITPREEIWYRGSNYWTTSKIEGAQTRIDYNAGTAVVSVSCGDYSKNITVNVKSYADEYVENRINEILDEIITDGMTEYEKLNAVTTWVGVNTDYSGYYQSAKDMLIYECGDCWASTNTILAMCEKLGIRAKSRRGNQDAGAGTGHMNVFAVCDGKYYVAEAGYSGTKPRGHYVKEEPMAFSVSGSIVYQYDGYDTDVVVPSEINGKTIMGFGNGKASVFVSQDINSVSLPASITTIGDSALSGANGLSEIKVDKDNESFTVSGGVLYSKDMTKLILAPTALGNVVIAPTVTEISKTAIKGFTMDELVIPSSVRTIGTAAFSGTTIGKLTIREGIQTINNSAFSGCITDEIIIPESVTSLETAAFYNCKAGRIVLPDSITEIPEAAFYYSSVDSVELPQGITSIGKYAFRSCSNLKSVSIPKTVTTVGEDVFVSSSKLTDIFYGGTEEEWVNISFATEIDSAIKVWYGNTVRVTGLTAADTDILLTEKGQTAELALTILPDNASDKELTYTTDNKNVASVADGVVAAVGEGTCKITVLTNDGGYKVVFDVEVKYPKYKLSLDGATIKYGDYQGQTYGEFPKDAYITIKADSIPGKSFLYWEYEGDQIPTIPKWTSYVTFKMPDRDLDLKAVYEKVMITGLSIGGTYLQVCPDQEMQLYLAVTPSDADDSGIEWSSSDESVIVVDDKGLIKGVKPGEANITAAATDGSGVKTVKTIEVIEHVWLIESTEKTATCTESGLENYKCSKCGATKTKVTAALNHNYGEVTIIKEATCTETGESTCTCSRCGDVKNETIKALGHEMVVDLEVPATCEEAGLSQGSHCSRCNQVIDKQLVIPAGEHYITSVKITKKESCTEDGEIIRTCGKCNKEFTEVVPALGHDEVVIKAYDPTCTVYGNTEGIYCKRCDEVIKESKEISPLGHSYDEGVVTKEPGCTKSGEKVFTCSKCKYTYKEVIEALGHHVVTDEAVEAGCKTTGLTEGSHCDRCGQIVNGQAVVPAKGHQYGEGVEILEATCTENGTRQYTCSGCGKIKNEEIPALGHDVVVDKGTAPTCEEGGNIEGSHCGRCGIILEETGAVDALGHNYDLGVVTAPPTCETSGTIIRTCTRCNKTKEEEIPATGHEVVTDRAVSPTCEDAGLTEGSHCKWCEKILVKQTVIPATGHDYGEEIIIWEPGCESYGGKAYTCKVCGKTETEYIEPLGHIEVNDSETPATCENDGFAAGSHCSRCNKALKAAGRIPALGHDFVLQKTVKELSCTEDGEETYICSRCGETKTETVKTTGHKWNEGDITSMPTCTEPGVITYTCLSCGGTKTEHISALGHQAVTDAALEATAYRTGLTDGSHCYRCGIILVEQKIIPKLTSDNNNSNPDSGNNNLTDDEEHGEEDDDNDDTDSPEPVEVPGVGIISEDGRVLTDNDGVSYNMAANMEEEDIARNVKVADDKTGGKFTITKVTVKSGRVTGGTVDYSGAYNETNKKVTVPQTVKIAGKSFKVTGVAKNAFKNRKNITSVTIGRNVTKINVNAFKGCSKLKSITIKSTKLTKIGSNAFKGINSKAVFKVPKSTLKKYKKKIRKSGAPKNIKIKK